MMGVMVDIEIVVGYCDSSSHRVPPAPEPGPCVAVGGTKVCVVCLAEIILPELPKDDATLMLLDDSWISWALDILGKNVVQCCHECETTGAA